MINIGGEIISVFKGTTAGVVLVSEFGNCWGWRLSSSRNRGLVFHT